MNRQKQVAMLAAGALAAMVGQAAAQDRLVQEGRDQATRAAVRVYKSATGARIDVDAPGVHVRKQLVGRKAVTSLSGGGESLVIEFDGTTFAVAGTRGRVSATRGDEAKLTRARKLVAESPLAARAAALIGSMELGPTSPIAPLLLSTRAFLMGFSDDASGLRQVDEWMRQARLRTRIVRASYGELTATECWNEYTKEAIAAWIEFEDCMNNVKWWDPFGTTKCTLIYDLRALAAFAWWLDCSKLANFING